MTLTGNDIALALSSVHHAMAFHRRSERTDFGDRQLRALEALRQKLDSLLDHNDELVAASDGECLFKIDAMRAAVGSN